MQSIKNFRLATQGITAVLLFGIAFAAGGAEQMMRALPAPAAAQPIVAPTAVVAPAKPPNLNATIALPPTTKSGGVMQLSPDAACAMNNTPRISSINGRASGGIVFHPGDALNIAGCGFGTGGQVSLTGVSPLIIDAWADANIRAHIDPALSRVRDVDSGVKLYVKPRSGAEMLSQVTHSFKAVHQDTVLALLNPEIGVFSDIYGGLKTSVAGNVTRVSRSMQKDKFCPPVANQLSQMSDFFHIEIFDDSLPSGVGIVNAPAGTDQGLFEVIAVNYTNETDQTNWDTKGEQMVLVGDGGRAEYDKVNKGIRVTFQGHSTYVKKVFLGGGGNSTCTSSYTVSLTVRAPRGFKPVVRVRPVTGTCRGPQCR